MLPPFAGSCMAGLGLSLLLAPLAHLSSFQQHLAKRRTRSGLPRCGQSLLVC